MSVAALYNLLINTGLYGTPVLAGAKRGNKYMEEKNYEPLDVRLRKSSVGDTSLKTGSENTTERFDKFREKVATISQLGKQVGSVLAEAGGAGAAAAGTITPQLFGSLLGIEALGQALGGVGNLVGPSADVMGTRANRYFLGPKGVMDAARMPENVLESGSKSFGGQLGKDLGEGVTSLVKGIMSSPKNLVIDSHKRKSILEQLRNEDPLIKKIPMKQALEAYHTMVEASPILSKDKNAVKSYLRSVAMAPEGGVDWNTIKGLADTESSLRKAKGLDVR